MSDRMRVEASLSPLQAILTSGRHRREARKWPWAWWCTDCDDAYGASKTHSEAQAAAAQHELRTHGSETSLAGSAQGQTSPSKGDQVT